MKNTYAAPALIKSGNIADETKGSVNPTDDTIGLAAPVGSVGFYL